MDQGACCEKPPSQAPESLLFFFLSLLAASPGKRSTRAITVPGATKTGRDNEGKSPFPSGFCFADRFPEGGRVAAEGGSMSGNRHVHGEEARHRYQWRGTERDLSVSASERSIPWRGDRPDRAARLRLRIAASRRTDRTRRNSRASLSTFRLVSSVGVGHSIEANGQEGQMGLV